MGYRWCLFGLIYLLLSPWSSLAAPPSPVVHALHVRLDPATQHLEVQDTITLPADLLAQQPQSLTMFLHRHLRVQPEQGAYHLEPASMALPDTAVPLQAYQLKPRSGTWPETATMTLRYQGTVHHPLTEAGDTITGGGMASAGLIAMEGAVLSGSTWWVPTFTTPWVTFTMTVEVPAAWQVVSQGQRTRDDIYEGRRLVRWESAAPMEEVYLLAGPWHVYAREAQEVQTYAFLRQPDAALAAQYLDITMPYIAMYSALIGAYPYRKFAVVENFWETGYGMPSFTLLGSQVLRLPFIPYTSYPHEILHNWWGNGVYVDDESGNWSEGLTAYLADHLLKEAQGQGAEYRRTTLQSYRSYVSQGKDFPLSEFRTRHSAATQAVGYGKALMMWHMLRQELGDEVFVEGLRHVYRTHRFQRASFADLAQRFMDVSGRDLHGFFQQWLQRTGAPSLSMQVIREGADSARVLVRQETDGEAYRLTIPVVLTFPGETRVESFHLETTQGQLSIPQASQLQRVDVDPQFDVFRRLHHAEVPPSLGQLFGAERALFILPAADDIETAAWRTVAETWAQRQGTVEMRLDHEVQDLPQERAVWIFGNRNRWQRLFAERLPDYGAALSAAQLTLGDTTLDRQAQSFVIVLRHPTNAELAVGWISAASQEALPGLLRKIPHYGKYSYLAFRGAEPTNSVKGQWPVLDSPLTWVVSGSPWRAMGALPPRSLLARPGL